MSCCITAGSVASNPCSCAALIKFSFNRAPDSEAVAAAIVEVAAPTGPATAPPAIAAPIGIKLNPADEAPSCIAPSGLSATALTPSHVTPKPAFTF